MIQIRKIREYTPKGSSETKRYDSSFETDILIENHDELFNNLDKFIDKIPEGERYNCFYTLCHVPGGKNRKFVAQDIIGFDIDGIEVLENGHGPFRSDYYEALYAALGVREDQIKVIYTGNGFQAIIKNNANIKDEGFFQKYKPYYKILTERITRELRARGLAGNVDLSAFEPNRMFRLPGTRNVKPNKKERISKLMKNPAMSEYDFVKATGCEVPECSEEDCTEEVEYICDTEAVLQGCEFLKWCHTSSGEVHEPQFYAALSILSRLDGGIDRCKALWQKVVEGGSDSSIVNYSPTELEVKINQAMEKSLPRTCANISSSISGECAKCSYKGKVLSPISLKSDRFIATEKTGFHQIVKNKDGKIVKRIPKYDDLRKFFERKTNYKYDDDSKTVMVWNGKFYTTMSTNLIEAYAQEKFNPLANTAMVTEFRKLVERTNIISLSNSFHELSNKINFSNGILDMSTNEFMAHTHTLPFQYVLECPYTPDARTFVYDQFMDNITVGDAELKELLERIMAACVFNVPNFLVQRCFIFTGSGANGKSTLIDLLQKICNNYTSLVAEQLKNPFNLSRLMGKNYNVSEETPKFTDSRVWEIVKNICSGGTITAEQKFKEPVSFTANTKMIFTTNNTLTGITPGNSMYRRILRVPFDAEFSYEKGNLDKFILDKMLPEIPGIINRIIEAYKRLKEDDYRFPECERTTREIEAMKLEIDTVHEWITENCQVVPKDVGARIMADSELGSRINASVCPWMMKNGNGEYLAVADEMFAAYRLWCERQGNKPVNAKEFKTRFEYFYRKEGIKRERTYLNHSKQWVFRKIIYQF